MLLLLFMIIIINKTVDVEQHYKAQPTDQSLKQRALECTYNMLNCSPQRLVFRFLQLIVVIFQHFQCTMSVFNTIT